MLRIAHLFLANCKMPLCKSGNILQSSVEKPLFFLILVCIIQQRRRRCVKILSFGANHLRLFDPFAPYFIDSYSHLRKLAMCTLSHVAKLFERISFSSKRTYVHVRTHRIFSLRVYTNIFCILYM